MNNPSVIRVVSMAGYPKHGLYDLVSEVLSADVPIMEQLDSASWGVHQYPWNSEGHQLHIFTNHAIPTTTLAADVWSGLWDAQDDLSGHKLVQHITDGIYRVSPAKQFEVDGQKYEWVMELQGYDQLSDDSTDPRYGE